MSTHQDRNFTKYANVRKKEVKCNEDDAFK